MKCFSAGQPLGKLEQETNAFCMLMGAYRQELWTSLTLPLLQLVDNFMGRSEDPLVLTGRVIDQEVALKRARDTQNATTLTSIYAWRLILAYYFNDYNLAFGKLPCPCNMVSGNIFRTSIDDSHVIYSYSEMAIQSRIMEKVGRSGM